MFQAPATASLQLVLTGQAASTRTSGLHGKSSTPVLGLLSSQLEGSVTNCLCQHLLEQKFLGSAQCLESKCVGFGNKLLQRSVRD